MRLSTDEKIYFICILSDILVILNIIRDFVLIYQVIIIV